MNGTWLLARRYLAHHRWRSALLVVGIALTLLLPLAVQLLVTRYGEAVARRAEATPLVLGAPGSRFDLILDSLYFRGRTPRPLSMAAVDDVLAAGRGRPIPLFSGVRADGHPVLGTNADYYGFRGLRCSAGGLPLLLGECVLGSAVAVESHLRPGDTLRTESASLYDLAGEYPLELQVVGVLEPSGGPDDGAVFCDLRTAWIAVGLGHGHDPAEVQGEGAVIGERGGAIVLAPKGVRQFQRITDANRDSFHFHGGPESLPLTAILIEPTGIKGDLLKLRGKYVGESSPVQALVPSEVMQELFGVVFRVKIFFDANALLVGVATALFLTVIVALSLAVRRRERLTLFKLGCARSTVARLMATELGLLALAALALAGVGAVGVVTFLSQGIGAL